MKPRLSIRTKLLLLSAGLLCIPLVGYQFIREMERHLQAELERSLSIAVGLVAARLEESPQLFPGHQIDDAYSDEALFLHPLQHSIQVDGYADDWAHYLDWANEYESTSGQLVYKLIVGQHQDYLYGFVRVSDERIVYRRHDSARGLSDRLHLVLRDRAGRLQRYVVASSAPGPQHPYQLLRGPGDSLVERPLTNVNSAWQEDSAGYSVEFRLPEYLVGADFSLEVIDVDDPEDPTLRERVGTAGADTIRRPAPLLRTSTRVRELLTPMATVPGRRVWVLGSRGQVLASVGSLRKEIPKHPLNLLFSIILPSAHERFEDDLAGASRITGSDVGAALAGDGRIRWRSSPDERAVIVSVARPVLHQGKVLGAVMMEESTNSIQTVQRQAMADLLNVTLISFVLVTLLILAFAARLSFRLRRLVYNSEHAIDEHGRVIGTMQSSNDSDEIGDVSRSFAAMMSRLQQYNRYLESMASRLSHELQTPLAVVRSSLESIDADALPEQARQSLQRADGGTQRLARLIARLREATRLEQALQASEKESVDLVQLVRGCLAGYRSAYGATQFRLETPQHGVCVDAAPDLLVQMLDKLVANAVEFHAPGTAITVGLANGDRRCRISVRNLGPCLPDNVGAALFESMVSVRQHDSRSEGPHLGLGLYIARLIAEFHGGRISAENRVTPEGVELVVTLPLPDRGPGAGARP